MEHPGNEPRSPLRRRVVRWGVILLQLAALSSVVHFGVPFLRCRLAHFHQLSCEDDDTKLPVLNAVPRSQETIIAIRSDPPGGELISPRSGTTAQWEAVEKLPEIWDKIYDHGLSYRYYGLNFWWSPRNRKIFLLANKSADDSAVIFSLDLDGHLQQVYQLLQTDWIESAWRWDAACTVLGDIEQLACAGQKGKLLEIQIESLHGPARKQRLSISTAGEFSPVVAWAPDGRSLYNVDDCAADRICLQRIELIGKQTKNLGQVANRPLPKFVLSPDGTQMAIVAPYFVLDGEMIELADTMTGERHAVPLPRIKDGNAHEGVHGLAWSPDGKRLLLQSDLEGWCASSMGIGGCVTAYYLVGTDGQGFTRISSRHGYGRWLLWIGAH